MHSLVKDLMTTPVVTVEPTTPFKEIVARLAQHRVSAVRWSMTTTGSWEWSPRPISCSRRSSPEPDKDIPLWWTKRARLERAKAAASVARDLMTVAVVSNAPEATAAEAARRMHTAGVKRLPVVEGGRLVGILSREDLLKVFDRSDAAIRREIIEDVIVGEFMMAPSRFFLHVTDGVVVLQGRVERRSLLPYLVRAVQGVEGVVRVEDRLAYDLDDRNPDGVMTYPWIRA